MLTIGSILIAIFIGPYKELQNFQSTYILASCKANKNYFYYEKYGIPGTKLSACEMEYKNINGYKVLKTPDYHRDGCPTNIWSIFEGVDAYVFNETTNTTINVGPIRIRHPSTSYSSMYTDKLKKKQKPWDYYLTMRPCYISPNYKGTGFVEINYKHKIEIGFYASIVFLSISPFFTLLYIIELIHKPLIFLSLSILSALSYITNSILNFLLSTKLEFNNLLKKKDAMHELQQELYV